MNKPNHARKLSLLALIALTLGVSMPAGADPQDGARFSRSLEGRATASQDLRKQLESAPVSEQAAIVLDGPRVSPGRVASGKRIGAAAGTGIRTASHDTVDFEIYGASSEVFYDLDRDGFFHGFAITFDADVSAGWADVFAELFLSRNGGPWNHYYTTRVFSIFEVDSADAYEVVTDLDIGYPTGDYDVLIELYDADSGDFLTDYGPDEDPALAWLPLEDAELDTPYYDQGHYGGGGSGPALLIFITLLVAWRQRQRDRAAVAIAGGTANNQARGRR